MKPLSVYDIYRHSRVILKINRPIVRETSASLSNNHETERNQWQNQLARKKKKKNLGDAMSRISRFEGERTRWLRRINVTRKLNCA